MLREAAKRYKALFFSRPATKRDGGDKGMATKKRKKHLKLVKRIAKKSPPPKKNVATKLEGGGE